MTAGEQKEYQLSCQVDFSTFDRTVAVPLYFQMLLTSLAKNVAALLSLYFCPLLLYPVSCARAATMVRWVFRFNETIDAI